MLKDVLAAQEGDVASFRGLAKLSGCVIVARVNSVYSIKRIRRVTYRATKGYLQCLDVCSLG